MELTPEQAAETRLIDGIGTDSDIDLIGDADISAYVKLRADVAHGLCRDDAPSIAGHVMVRIGRMGLDVGEVVRDEAGPEGALVDSVMGRLGINEAVGEPIRTALHAEAGAAPSLWGDIAVAVGAEPPLSLGEMLRGAVADEAGAGFVQSTWLAPQRRRWVVGAAAGAVFAMAAALLLYVGLAGSGEQMMEAAMGPILEAPVDIESLDAGDNQTVQILQFGHEAPTIILIDDLGEGIQ